MDVRPLDPLSCPDQDRIQVTLKNEEESLTPTWMEGIECQVHLGGINCLMQMVITISVRVLTAKQLVNAMKMAQDVNYVK